MLLIRFATRAKLSSCPPRQAIDGAGVAAPACWTGRGLVGQNGCYCDSGSAHLLGESNIIPDAAFVRALRPARAQRRARILSRQPRIALLRASRRMGHCVKIPVPSGGVLGGVLATQCRQLADPHEKPDGSRTRVRLFPYHRQVRPCRIDPRHLRTPRQPCSNLSVRISA